MEIDRSSDNKGDNEDINCDEDDDKNVADDEGDEGRESEGLPETGSRVKALRPLHEGFVIPEGGIIGKGKAANNQAPSPSKTSVPGVTKAKVSSKQSRPRCDAITSLGKCIPPEYAVLQDPLEDDELVELDWFALTNSGLSADGRKIPAAPVKGVPTPASQALPTRHWHSFRATRMTLDEEFEDVGEVRLSEAQFCFPFEAQVI